MAYNTRNMTAYEPVSDKTLATGPLSGKVQVSDEEAPDANTLGRDNSILEVHNQRVEISLNKPNVVKRIIDNISYDTDDLNELSSKKIYELLPKPVQYPISPPIGGKVYAAGWSRIINYGGILDPTRNPIVNKILDWAELDDNNEPIDQNIEGNWLVGHSWPRDSVMDATYLFFGQDPAIFYVKGAISYNHPKTGKPVPVDDNDIVWKKGGKEIHRGWYLELDELEPTVQIINNVAVVIPVEIDLEITNKEGFISEKIKYVCINSDDAAAITSAGIESEEDNFTSTLEGRFKIDEAARGVIWEDDPRYEARTFFARFQWASLGSKMSPVRKFKGNARVRVDGKTVWRGSAKQLDGQKSAFGEWFDDFLGPMFATVHSVAFAPFAFVNIAKLAAGKPNIYSQIWNDQGDVLEDDRPLSERGVTDWTDGRQSALLYTNKDDDEWNALVEFKKKPGPFKIEVGYDYTIRKGLFRWGKKYRRTYSRVVEYTDAQLNLDTPLQPIDIGLFTINHTTERA